MHVLPHIEVIFITYFVDMPFQSNHYINEYICLLVCHRAPDSDSGVHTDNQGQIYRQDILKS